MPTGDSKDPDVTLSLATAEDFDDLTSESDEIDEYSTALDVEAQLLCSLLWAPAESAKRAVAALTSADFYRPVNAALFTAISELVEAGKPHNSAHVFTTLQQEGRTSGHLGKQLTKGHCQVVWCAAVFGHSRPSHGVVSQAARVCSVT